jgi:hypothetical protein
LRRDGRKPVTATRHIQDHRRSRFYVFLRSQRKPIKQNGSGGRDVEGICHSEHGDRDSGIRRVNYLRRDAAAFATKNQDCRKHGHELFGMDAAGGLLGYHDPIGDSFAGLLVVAPGHPVLSALRRLYESAFVQFHSGVVSAGRMFVPELAAPIVNTLRPT